MKRVVTRTPIGIFALVCAVISLGCGSSGDSDFGPPIAEGQASGRIKLPSGFSGNRTGLLVITGEGTFEPVGTGYVVDKAEDGLALAVVVDSDDDVVLTGFIGPGQQNTLDVRSTAVVSAYFGAHLFELPPETREGTVSELSAHPAMDTLADVFTEALARDAKVLMSEDAALLAAVEAALGTIAAGGDGLAVAVGAVNAGNANVVVDPLTPQSDVLVGPNLTGTGMQLYNDSRRMAWYYVYETGYRDAGGADVTTDPPKLLADGWIDGAAGVNAGGGTLGTLGDALTNSLDFNAKTLATPIGLTVADNQQRLYVETIVAGAYIPGVNGPPSWYDSGNPLHAEWLTRAQLMTTATFARDVVIPAIFSVVLPIKGGADKLITLPDVQGLVTVLLTQVPTLAVQLDAGEWGGALKTVLKAMANNSNVRTQVITELGSLISKLAPARAATAVNAMMKANFYLAVVDIGLAGLDIAMVVHDVEAAQPLERWEVTAIKAKVLVRSERQTLRPGRADTRLTALVQGAGPADYYCYLWEVTEGPGRIGGLLDGPETGSDRSAVSGDGEAFFEVDGKDIRDGPLATIKVTAYTRDAQETCTFPVGGDLVGEGKVGLLGKEDPYVDPCEENMFDFDYWNHFSVLPDYTIEGSIGGVVTVTLDVPPVAVAGEGEYRDVTVVIPRAVDPSRRGVTVSGDTRSLGVDDNGRVIEARPDQPIDRRYAFITLGVANIEFSAKGPVTVSVPTRGYEDGCSALGQCCPHWIFDENRSTSVIAGPLAYIQMDRHFNEDGYRWSVITPVEVNDE